MPTPEERTSTAGRRPATRRVVVVVAALAAIAVAVTGVSTLVAAREPAAPPYSDMVATINSDRSVSEFDGTDALGAGVDGLEAGEIDIVWTPENIDLMESAGFGPLSFRLRTELGVKAWHWNPEGTWSDPQNEQGYWVSSSTSTKDHGVSYGYDLPRRGHTIDQAKNDGYSRLTDGDESTFWKSNPYLDPHFTGESDTEYPQWMMLAYPRGPVPVDTLKVSWGEPYAQAIKVQYWVGEGGAIYPAAPDGQWLDFPTSEFSAAGGEETFVLAPEPVSVQYVRVQLTGASGTGPADSRDIRDRLGYAVREVSLGETANGGFQDQVVHVPSQEQTITYTSSTDPWHRAGDIDGNYEHASLDRVFESGLTSGKPLLAAVPVLYGVPEDAAALLRYVRSRNYPVEQIEMGEEPDGQLAQPEHYAALYGQVADALKEVDPDIQLGGPGYQTTLPDWIHWPDEDGVKSWTGRFVSHLREHDRMADFNFFSFEWYPFDDVCADTAQPLQDNPRLLADILRKQEEAGLPPEIPTVITELGYSAFAGQPEVELAGAILNTETTAKFLELGGDTVYFYGLEPNWVFQEDEGRPCDTWGNLMLWQFYDEWETRPVAAFHGAHLVNTVWVQPGDGTHEVLATEVASTATGQGDPAVTAYALRRPDGRLSVLMFNKDPQQSTSVRLETLEGAEREVVTGSVDVAQYSGLQYQWDPTQGTDSRGRPSRNDPPFRETLEAAEGAVVDLPPSSITVVTMAE
ncbi:hypothetical protein [Modestobacter lapidis]|nr:hypothetical protein [Modestobacter lapidis]